MIPWKPKKVPAFRRDLRAAHEADRQAIEKMRAKYAHAPARYSSAMDAGLAEIGQQVRALGWAGMYWVGADMARLALDAATDCPGIEGGDAPSTSGFLLVEGPLPAFDTSPMGGLTLRGEGPDHMDPVPIDGLLWEIGADVLDVALLCRAERLPRPLTRHQGRLAAFLSLKFPLPGRFSETTVMTVEGALIGNGQALGVAAWLSSMWVMTRQPTTARTRKLDARTGEYGMARVPADSQVVVIDMQKRIGKGSGGDATGRTLTTRHLVRGYWTHQAYGPGKSLRRLQWIEPYVRGPEGAPLAERERVWAWRTR